MANERTGPVQPPKGAAAERQQAEQAIERQQYQTLSQLLERNQAQIERVIPDQLNPKRLLRVALSAVARDRKLLACTGQSVLQAVMQSAVLGLEIGVLGEAYLIPFRDNTRHVVEAKFIPGYQGLVKLAIQSGAVAGCHVGAVYPGEVFDYEKGSNPFIKHKPDLKQHDPKTLIAAYASWKMRGSDIIVPDVMGKEQIDAIRARSRSANDGPWVTDYEPMAIKTVIRRSSKYVPKTPQLSRAIEIEDRAETSQGTEDLFPELDGVTLPGELAEPTKEQRSVVDAAADALGAKSSDVAGLNAEHDRNQGREPGSDG